MNESAFEVPPEGFCTPTVSLLYASKVVPAGTLIPLREFRLIPENLRKRKYWLFPDQRSKPAAANGDSPQNLIFELGANQSVDAEGVRHSRSVQRRVNLEQMRVEAEQELEQAIKHELEHPDEQTAKALEILQQDADAHASLQIAQGQASAREHERADAIARDLITEANQEVAGIVDAKHVVSPDVQEWNPKPRRMRKRFVKRGQVWMRTKQLKHFRTGEQVYVKNADGKFHSIGEVNKNGKPPACYMEDHL